MNQTANDSRHDQVALLLPWYLNDTLSAAQRRQVEEHIHSCRQCAEELQHLRGVAAIVGNEPTAPLVPEPPVDAFLSKLDNAPAKGSPSRRTGPVWAAAASLLIIVAAGAVYMQGQRPAQTNVFDTVTREDAAALSYVFEVDYTEDLREQSQVALLETIPGAVLMQHGDTFRMEVTMPPRTVSELDAFAESLKVLDGVERVTLVGVQLPIE